MINDRAVWFVVNAATAETTAAIEAHGHFNSPHEAYAVLLEEVEEIHDASTDFEIKAKKFLSDLWENVRNDFHHDTEETLQDLKNAAFAVAFECVQVAAMCEKWGLLLESEAATNGAGAAE